jgi:hypothetical protein
VLKFRPFVIIVLFVLVGELPRSGIPNHVSTNLLNGNVTDAANERRSPATATAVHPPTTKSQIKVVTPPLRYSPKTAQQPLGQPPVLPTSLPFSTQLSSLSANQAHHPTVGQTAPIVDHNSVPPHHYTPPTTQSQQPTVTAAAAAAAAVFPPSQHALPIPPHSQYSSSSHYPLVSYTSNFNTPIIVRERSHCPRSSSKFFIESR